MTRSRMPRARNSQSRAPIRASGRFGSGGTAGGPRAVGAADAQHLAAGREHEALPRIGARRPREPQRPVALMQPPSTRLLLHRATRRHLRLGGDVGVRDDPVSADRSDDPISSGRQRIEQRLQPASWIDATPPRTARGWTLLGDVVVVHHVPTVGRHDGRPGGTKVLACGGQRRGAAFDYAVAASCSNRRANTPRYPSTMRSTEKRSPACCRHTARSIRSIDNRPSTNSASVSPR